MNYKIDAKTLESIISYMANKPWAEVNNLIIILSKLEKIEEDKK